MFAVHGIPVILESDNGPKFSSKEFKAFDKKWDLTHQTSSPRYPKSNGLGERFVQVEKSLLNQCHEDQSEVYLALLNYRNTPRSNDLLSPNQRLMSRRTRTNIPSSEQSLKPKVVQNLQHNLIEARNRSKFYADKGSHQKQPFQPGEKIRIQQPNRNWISGTVVKPANTPRSYMVQTDDGSIYRRNSSHLHKTIRATVVPQKYVMIDPTADKTTTTSSTSYVEPAPTNTLGSKP
ncbi:uncharacterized protein K02A2.6-like [Eupeodes corollae]|uniref:uncharacterized protein K02A2.6-like n=1 Tax=Eupeodes corollae TaxID=290404 RepID=UPI00248FA2FE|nr:uncharacterized protein K02A2.6-like [Eupeodes corollae]